eukprot:13516102-Heterocapsa_arctica.AAC.1
MVAGKQPKLLSNLEPISTDGACVVCSIGSLCYRGVLDARSPSPDVSSSCSGHSEVGAAAGWGRDQA